MKRAALEICIFRDSLESLGSRARCIPHDRDASDCLTKLKANVKPSLKLMRKGCYQLVEEAEEMVHRKIYREATGKKDPRPNVSIASSHISFMRTALAVAAKTCSVTAHLQERHVQEAHIISCCQQCLVQAFRCIQVPSFQQRHCQRRDALC